MPPNPAPDATNPALLRVLAELARAGKAPAEGWPPEEDPELYGLVRRGGRITAMVDLDPLDADAIRAGLSSRAGNWLRELDLRPVIGSTSAELVNRARDESVAGRVCSAELQLAGRGRRGRSWLSPFGASLAVSAGFALERPPAALAGASLVVGLAALDALEGLGVPELALKWPNDLLGAGDKLGGILVEMVPSRGRAGATELVVGIGINVTLPGRLRSQLPAGVTDLASLAPPPPRNLLLARILSAVLDFLGEFEERGFEPFRPAFDLRHRFQGEPCQVLQGERATAGTVVGVSEQGGLILDTGAARREFHAGEVSLRPRG